MSFITIDKLNGSSGETISTITVPEYQGLEDRTQSFKVVVDGKEVFVNVQQKAFKPSLTTNKQVVAFTQDVITQSLQITSNFNWEARTDSSWFTLSQTEGNKGTTTIEISTSSIESPSENRNGTINFYFGNTFVTAITITQEFEIIFEVEKLIDVTYGQELKIKSNILWNATVNDSDWFTISPFSGVSGVTTMNIILLDELEDVSRSGKIKFYNDSILLEEVSVVQYTEGVPFYIEPIDSNVEIGLKDGTILYSYDVEGVWQELNTNSTIVINQKVFFKEWKHYNSIGAFNIQGKCNVGGDITNVCGRTMKEHYAYWLFENCDVVDASNLILPFKTLGKSAYENMFYRCKYLTTAPKLVATKLDSYCYYMMFKNCTSLLVAPELPSTNLAVGCYQSMFSDCTSLLVAPELPATILTDDCYEAMFQGCTSLVNAPELTATTLVRGCYLEMFKYCSNLNNITMLATDISAKNCLGYWVSGLDGVGVSPTGIFTKKKGVEIPYGVSGIPNENWTVIEIQ